MFALLSPVRWAMGDSDRLVVSVAASKPRQVVGPERDETVLMHQRCRRSGTYRSVIVTPSTRSPTSFARTAGWRLVGEISAPPTFPVRQANERRVSER